MLNKGFSIILHKKSPDRGFSGISGNISFRGFVIITSSSKNQTFSCFVSALEAVDRDRDTSAALYKCIT